MSTDVKTRHSQRQRKFAPLSRNTDRLQLQIRQQNRIDALESDYYESPNKLAEDDISDDFDAKAENMIGSGKNGGKQRQIKKKKLVKKVKINSQIRKNLNLKKILKEETNKTQLSIFPNFINIRANQDNNKAKRKYCSICLVLAKYTCPRCTEHYCSMECCNNHKEIQCLRADA